MAGWAETERLILRRFREEDRGDFAAMSADWLVMRHFPATLDRAASDAAMDRIEAAWQRCGFGFAALERKSDGVFVGLAGLNRVTFSAAFTPAVEIGWRLSRDHWGRGYATEAAIGALRRGFGDLGLDEIVSFTIPANHPSRAVMDRLGMTEVRGGRFLHPALPPTHWAARHVLYRLRREDFRQ